MTTHAVTQFEYPASVKEVAQRLQSASGEAYLVGGAVRDILMGQSPKDFDFATQLPPEKVMALFPFAVPTGIKHGTVTVWLEPHGKGPSFEVTTYRTESDYSDGRHPDRVNFVQTIEEDLSRRDFTMNAIAIDPLNGRMMDPFDGHSDIQNHTIRTVGEAIARFREDGLRPMRAVRFAACLGFTIEAQTFNAITAALDVVNRVAVERIRDELIKLLGAPKPSIGFELMRNSGLLELILPELLEGVGMAQSHHHALSVYDHILAAVDAAEDQTARLSALFHDIAKPRTIGTKPNNPNEICFYRHDQVGAELTDVIMRRLKFSNDEREKIVSLVRNHMFWYDPIWSDGSVRRFVKRVGEESLDDLFKLRRADIIARGKNEDPIGEIAPLQTRIEAVLKDSRALTVKDLALNGQDVMKLLNIPASPTIGKALDFLLEQVMEKPHLNQQEALSTLLKETFKSR